MSSSTIHPEITYETMSTYSLFWDMIGLKLENQSTVLVGNLATKPGFTDKQCMVRLILGGCWSELHGG